MTGLFPLAGTQFNFHIIESKIVNFNFNNQYVNGIENKISNF